MTGAAAAGDPARGQVGYKDLREYLDVLDSRKLLHRVTAEVELQDEIGAIAARSLERKGPALLFESIKYGLICQRIEDYPRQLLRSGSLQSRVIAKTGLTNIKEVYFPEVGRMGMLIVSAKIRDRSDPKRIMDAIWNDTGEAWRWIIVVDEDCNVRDWEEVMWRVVSTADPEKHVVLGKQHTLRKRLTNEVDFDPPSRGMGIDATLGFKDAQFPPINKVSAVLMEKVAARWKEYGLS